MLTPKLSSLKDQDHSVSSPLRVPSLQTLPLSGEQCVLEQNTYCEQVF